MSVPFDFDYWRELAQRDPAAFFRERERVIREFIDDHPATRTQLLALQAQVDGLRATAGTPALALQGIVGLMDDHLIALTGHLKQLREEADRFRELLSGAN